MARRFGSSFMLGSDPITFAVNPLTNTGSPITATALGSLTFADDCERVLIAPSAYSAVRKVVFWCSFRHEHTAASQPVIPCRLRVAPQTSDANARVPETIQMASSSFNWTTGAGSVFATNALSSEDCFYTHRQSASNEVDALQWTSLTDGGAQVLYQEFDRFDASDADFFNDWDEIAARGDLTEHLPYSCAVERIDGVAWTNAGTGLNTRLPVIVACGFAVVQAPSPTNNTRLYLPATHGEYEAGSITATYGLLRTCPFFWHADEWDGDVEVRLVTRMRKTGGSTAGDLSVQVSTITNQSVATTSIYTESFNDTPPGNGTALICRSADLVPSLTDGDIVIVNFKSDTGASQDQPFAWWEITHRGFNKGTFYFPCGMPPQIGSRCYDGFGKAESLIDPLWFQDMESERFLDARVQGGFRHVTGSDEEQGINLNARLGDDVVGSAFNVSVNPSVSSTPNATTPARKLIDSDLVSPDPLNLAGKRKVTESFTLFASTALPGSMTFLYVVDVPNTDVIALGPLFDVGAFDAEGCAATSAGLGEPGLLIITNGSTIPKKFNPTAAGTDGEIEDASLPIPFEGETPTTLAADAASSPEGGLGLGTYAYRYTFRNCCTGKESDPNPDDITVDTSAQSPAASVTISFAGVRIPADPQICEICLYRTLAGGDYPIMAKVGCFNVDETTVFVDDLADDALDFLNDGLSILNGPMPCVTTVVDFRNRLFGLGDIPNLATDGTVSVVEGSDLIEGNSEVEWDRCLEGKFIKVGNDCRSYEILRVLPPELGTSPPIARLRLVEPYEGVTDTGLTYIVCGRPNRLYFSEPLEPECWPAAGFIDIEPGDGDRLMGAVSNFDSLVICKRRKTYVLRFSVNPGLEVFVPYRISSDIGCIGPRTFAQVESGSVWLSDRGLALYDGRTVQHVPESSDMNDMFVDPANPRYVRRDRNGRVIEAVGVFYPKREQYLLLLPTVKTNRGCNVMLVWDVKMRNITILEFCQEFLSMEVAKDTDGNERVYLGDTNGFVWIYDVGDTDGVGYPNATGTVRGTVTEAGIDETTGASYFDDASASFITGGIPSFAGLSAIDGFSNAWGGADVGIAGACVYVRRKDASYYDPWTVRTIYASTQTRLYVTPQWGPDTPIAGEFDYMIGAIEFNQLFKPQNYGSDDTSKRDWRQIVVHEQEDFASKLRIELLPDFQLSDPEDETVVDPVTGDVGEGRVFRMDYSKGRQVKPVGRNVHFFMGIRMHNFAPEEPIQVINHLLCVRPRKSK